ncbi:hypothetical protein [Corynebacterium aquatimens]|uniref:Uncharacterized protein n=1 Tax=Corynebacterium aquatimens TaxID=1190508 RepID=A0A931E461_9CORY|nr:hypothetical protein [Corynebacterium aquatimens]MBG6122801.1 hypothetical protein [Corynebacterium aquatimens]WJY66864.1 hypothetical protein CAQUA_10890 [Corynebacterium aquatimens]
MNLDAILNQLTAFFGEGIGKAIADFLTFIYNILFPPNAGPAERVEIPR